MKIKILLYIILILGCNFQIAAGAENDYGIVKAWFNGENATVEGVQIKMGELIEIKVEVVSKINGDITLTLREPGVTKAFNVIKGPSKEDEWLDNLKIDTGWTNTYIWTITPNGAWKGGNAPINIFVQFNKGMDNKKIQFTIANPYILDEQYTGAPTITSTAPKITESGAPMKAAPFLSPLMVLAVLILSRRWR